MRNGECSTVLKKLSEELKKASPCKPYPRSFFFLKNGEHGLEVEEGIKIMNQNEVQGVSKEQNVIANTHTHQLVKVNDLDLGEVEHYKELDLGDGKKWKGDVLENQPFGWGVARIGEKREYEGFRIGDVNTCYGTKYDNDEQVVYEGYLWNDMQWGNGVMFDQGREVVYNGEWMRGEHNIAKRVELLKEEQLLHTLVEDLIVGDGFCNGEEWRVLDLTLLSTLKKLQVGNGCFCSTLEVMIVGLHKLESVMIGSNSFVTHAEGRFCLKNCERITTLKIGNGSFAFYTSCEIENAPCLETIEMGEMDEKNAVFHDASLVLRGEGS